MNISRASFVYAGLFHVLISGTATAQSPLTGGETGLSEQNLLPCGASPSKDCLDRFNEINATLKGKGTYTERKQHADELLKRISFIVSTGTPIIACDMQDQYDEILLEPDIFEKRMKPNKLCYEYKTKTEVSLISCAGDYRLCKFIDSEKKLELWTDIWNLSLR